MLPERIVEFAAALPGIGIARGCDFPEHVGMAAYRTLPENHHAAGQDIGAFHGDADRNLLIGTAKIIVRSQTDALAAVHVHRVVDHLAAAFGAVVFDDGRDHRRLLAQIDRTGRHRARGVDRISIAGHARERFFDAFEFADGDLELAACPAVRAGGAHRKLGRARARRRQRDGASGGEALHQHAPALAGEFAAADDPVHRDEHVLAPVRPVHERGVQRKVPATDVHAGVFGRNQRQGNADVLLRSQQAVGIVQPEGKAEQRGHRPERDVSLLPGQADADDFATFVQSLAHHAEIRDRTRVRTGFRSGQRKARHFQALRQARQIQVLLIVGAVVQQQFRRSQGIRHRNGRGRKT